MNNLIIKIQNALEWHKQGLYEEISRDYRENKTEVKYALLEENIKRFVNMDVSNKGENKTLLAIYNGNPYIMLEIVIMSLIYGNNIILISEGEKSYTSNKLISTIQEVVRKEEKPLIVKKYLQADFGKILKEDNLINRIIYFGDKRKYRQLKLNTNIETIYNGYGSVSVYVDDEDEFEDELFEIEEYANLNNLYIYKFGENINEAIKQINKDGKNDTCIILSKNKDKIEKFKCKINSLNILVNEADFSNLKHELPGELFDCNSDY